MDDEHEAPTVTSKVYTEQEFAEVQAYGRKVRDEAKGHRLAAANEAAAKAAAEAALTAAQATHTEALSKADARFIRSEVKAHAIASGAIDATDILALLPLADVKRDADGEPTNVAELLEALKAAKPHLFKPQGQMTGNTSNAARAPAANAPAAKSAKEMTKAEYQAALAALTR